MGSVLQMTRLRPREATPLTQGHTAAGQRDSKAPGVKRSEARWQPGSAT